MKKNKVWRIKGFEGIFSDEELISLIESKQVNKDFSITTREMKTWVKLKDSIYQYYLKEDEDETVQ